MVAPRASGATAKTNAKRMDAKPNRRIRLITIFLLILKSRPGADGVREPTTEGVGDCNLPRTVNQEENRKIAVSSNGRSAPQAGVEAKRAAIPWAWQSGPCRRWDSPPQAMPPTEAPARPSPVTVYGLGAAAGRGDGE